MGIVEFDVERLREVAIKHSDEKLCKSKNGAVLISNTALNKTLAFNYEITRIFRFAEFISVYHNSSRNRSNIALLVW